GPTPTCTRPILSGFVASVIDKLLKGVIGHSILIYPEATADTYLMLRLLIREVYIVGRLAAHQETTRWNPKLWNSFSVNPLLAWSQTFRQVIRLFDVVLDKTANRSPQNFVTGGIFSFWFAVNTRVIGRFSAAYRHRRVIGQFERVTIRVVIKA